MERLSDPDFAFFFRLETERNPNRSVQPIRSCIFDRTVRWKSEKNQKAEMKRLHACINELRACHDVPKISRRGRSVSSSFSARYKADLQAREENKVIAEFLKAQAENEAKNHPFQPDLSVTTKFKISKYITKPIRIPHII